MATENTESLPPVTVGEQKAREALSLKLPELSQRLNSTEDEADRWLLNEVLKKRTQEMVDQARQTQGADQLAAFAAEKKAAGEIDDLFINEVVRPVYRKRAKEHADVSFSPVTLAKDVKAAAQALPQVAGELITGAKAIASEAPAAISGFVKQMGVDTSTDEEKRAMEFIGAAAEQGTREGFQFARRALRRIKDVAGSPYIGWMGYVQPSQRLDDKTLDERFDEDISYHTRQKQVEAGQRDVGFLMSLLENKESWDRRREEILEINQNRAAEGKPPYVVPLPWDEMKAKAKAERPQLTEEQIKAIPAAGEYLDFSNVLPFGIGAKAVTKNSRVVAERALRTAAAEAAFTAAKQAENVGMLRRAVGGAVESAGKTAEKAMDVPTVRGAAAALTTLAVGGEPSAAVMSALIGGGTSFGQRAVKQGPTAVRRLGEMMQRPAVGPVGKFLETMGAVGAAGAYGAAAMAPTAYLAGETPEERGSLLAGGIAFGAGGGVAAKATNAVTSFGQSYWSPKADDVTVDRAPMSTYGTAFDVQHEAGTKGLDNAQFNRIEALRALIAPVSDLYVLNEADYNALPIPKIRLSQGVNSIKLPSGRNATFIKLGGNALAHEVGEVIFEALPLADQRALVKIYEQVYSPEVRAEMKARYENLIGMTITPERAAREAIAENFHAVFGGLPITRLGTPEPLAERIYRTVGVLGETLGLRDLSPGRGIVTSDALEYTPSFILRRALENTLESMMLTPPTSAAPTAPAPAPAPAPAAPGTPAPVVPSAPTSSAPVAPAAPAPAVPPTRPPVDVGVATPVPFELTQSSPIPTAGSISGLPAAPRTAAAPAPVPAPVTPTVRGVTETQRQEFVAPTPEQAKKNHEMLTEMASRPRGQQEFVQVNYLSAVPDPNDQSPDARRRREQRTLADAAEQYAPNFENPLRAVFEKVFAPYRSGGPNTVYGFSFDKLVQNVDILAGWLAQNPDVKIDLPYDLGSMQLRADVQTYLRNQSNGYGGDGSRLVRPADAENITPENPAYTPQPLSREVTDLINLLMGLAPAQKLTAKEEFNLRFARLNGLVPATLAKGGMEPNALRNELRMEGFDPGLLNGVLENLRTDRISGNVTPRPDLALPVGEGAFVRAGFMPEARRESDVRRFNIGLKVGRTDALLTPEEVQDVMRDMGLTPGRTQVRQSGTEPTLIVDVPANEVTEQLVDDLSVALGQEAIAVYDPAADTGVLYGPKAADWGPFNKDFFLDFTEETPGEINFMPAPPVESPAFKKWFGGSKVVDAQGKPLVLFRGDFPSLSSFSRAGDRGTRISGNIFATNNPNVAKRYARSRQDYFVNPDQLSEADGFYRIYMSLQNPLVVDARGEGWLEIPVPKEMRGSVKSTTLQIDDLAARARRLGYDGLIVRDVLDQHGEGDQYVAFRPEQIKSATDNVGTFDAGNPDIRYMPAKLEGTRLEHAVPEKKLKLTHFSNVAGLNVIDPAFMSQDTSKKLLRGDPRSFWMVGESKLKSADGARGKAQKYTTEVSGSKLYDMRTDPLELWEKPQPAIDKTLKAEGYAGFVMETNDGRTFAAVYEAIPLNRKGEQEAKTRAAEEERRQGALADARLPENLLAEQRATLAQDRTWQDVLDEVERTGRPLDEVAEEFGVNFMPELPEQFELNEENIGQFMPAPRVDLEDFIGKTVIAMPIDRLGIGEKQVGPRGNRRTLQAQGGRGYPLLYPGEAWAFSTRGAANSLLRRLREVNPGEKRGLVATTLLSETNLLKSKFGQLAFAEAYEAAIDAKLFSRRQVDNLFKEVFQRTAESANAPKSTITADDVSVLKAVKSLADFKAAAQQEKLSFSLMSNIAPRLDAKKLALSFGDRQAAGLDTLSVARDVMDEELVGLPNFAVVSVIEVDLDQTPHNNSEHVSYPWGVTGRLVGFLKTPYALDPLVADPRIRTKNGVITTQPVQTVLPVLSGLQETETNSPRETLRSARIEVTPAALPLENEQ